MKQTVAAGFIIYTIVDKKPFFLLLHSIVGHWGFPKGKLEEGETIEDAALRELYEETTLQPSHIIPDFSYSSEYSFVDRDGVSVHKKLVLFLAEVNTQLVALSDEHQNYAWLSYHDALAQLDRKASQDALKAAYTYMSLP